MSRRFVALLALGLAGCAGTPRLPAPAPSDSAGEITAIEVDVGPCFGTCPVYTARFEESGTVAFEGRRFTAANGAMTASRSPEAFAAYRQYLAALMPARGTEADFPCTQRITDQQSYTVRWTARDATVTTLHFDAGCREPAGIQAAETLRGVPDWLGITEWVKPATRVTPAR